MFDKVAAVIVLYNPLPTVIYNIHSYIDMIDCLYIIDNSTNRSDLISELYFKDTNIKVLHYGENIGIASALNLALHEAKKDKYEWLFTFDQDTYFYKDECRLFLARCKKLNLDKVVILSPLHNKKFITQKSKKVYEVDFVMTSANLLNIDIALKIGGFNEKLFIDEVDHEFCLRLRKSNYRILLDKTISVNHCLGISHSIFNTIKVYNQYRIYYMVRNYLYIRKQYIDFDKNFFNTRDLYIVKFLLKQIIFGKDRIKKIYYIFQGIIDYFNMRLGKLDI
jgi:rhamnosyltransferase